MSFLHPILAGAGLAAVAIPILIHLLMRRRRRPIDFGAMRFLLEGVAHDMPRALWPVLTRMIAESVSAPAAVASSRARTPAVIVSPIRIAFATCSVPPRPRAALWL